MSTVAAFAVPHPPLAIAAIGRGQERGIASTIAGYHEVARRIAELKPEVLIVTSPHATSYYDYIHIAPRAAASGDFAQFGDPDDEVEAAYDTELVRAIADEATLVNIPAGTAGEKSASLDHGTMVPLSFIQAAGTRCPIVRIGISGMTGLDHYRFGQCIARAVGKLKRRAVFVASGDLSHKLKKDGPYGYAAEGPEFDRQICAIFASGDFGSILRLDQRMCEAAAECGLPSFQMMAGALDGLVVRSELLSYEGTYGVGYGVAAFVPLAKSPLRHFGDAYERERNRERVGMLHEEDAYVRLARHALETWVGTHCIPSLPKGLPNALTRDQAGAFVSIHKDGALRGCIGTLEATRSCLGEEIIGNAISAGTRDPRFPSVTRAELESLTYSVDVLGASEVVGDPSELDPKRYGLIVSTPDGRRGVLLPDLPDVTSTRQQIAIACRKAGIDPYEALTLQRFEVERHQ